MVPDSFGLFAGKRLPLGFAFDLGMELAPIQVEHAHGDGARRPVNVADKLDRTDSFSASPTSVGRVDARPGEKQR